MIQKPVELRAHHFYLIAKYHKSEEERAYQSRFGHRIYGNEAYQRMSVLIDYIDANPELEVRLVGGADSLCRLCSYIDESTRQCIHEKDEYPKTPLQLDEEVIKEKQLVVGATYKVKDVWDMFDIKPDRL